MADYPAREPFYSHRLTRLLFKSCAAQSIGQDAVLLVIHIAHTEDAAKYQGPVRFWNSQLNEVLGFHSPKTLNNARRKAVAAGWLVYERADNRSVGHYWTSTPSYVSRFNDEPIEPVSIPSTEQIKAEYSFQVRNESDNIHSTGGTNSGTNSGTNRCRNSIPIPRPIPNTSPESNSGRAEASLSKKKSQATEADLATARWIWELIRAMQPDRKPPNLNQWANDVRLMRERDGRTDRDIRDVFKRANADPFWGVNVLSPSKLREKFDDLKIKLNGKLKPEETYRDFTEERLNRA